ncbi:MAG: hypothetical protein HYS38_07175 [Acidobacteria bacterium]|nr:hypothetical protein [Acidobacteriota bacterium]
MLQAALPVPPPLSLPVPLHRVEVGPPVLPEIIRMPSAPFLLAIPADLTVLGIAPKLVAVIVPPALALTVGATANELVRMKTGRLKRLLAGMTAVIAHWAAPDRDASRSL